MKNQRGFAPLVIILLVVLGLGVVGGGYVVYKDKQEQKNFQDKINSLSDSSNNETNDKSSTNNVTVSSKNTTTFVYIPDPIYIAANNNFRKDEKNVYYNEKVLVNVDPITFEVVGGMYSKDKDSVFALSCWGEGFSGCIERISSADPATFKIITDTLAKDSLHVFYLGKILKDADPATIKIAGQEKYESKAELSFIKDKSHVWYVYGGGYAKLLPNADPSTFEPLSWYYSKDAKNVYFFDSIVSGANPITFELLKEIYYGKDNKNVYYTGKIIVGADPKTFSSIGGAYFKDSKAIYADGALVSGVDYKTFKPFPSTRFSLDTNHVYVGLTQGKLDIVPSADSVTFTVISENYGKDKNFVYFKNRKVPGADPATFRAVTYVGLDKNHYYEFDKVLNSPSESQYGGWEALGVEVSQ